MATNTSLVPSAEDLLMVFPRLAHLVIDRLPGSMGSIFGNTVKNASDAIMANVTSTNTTVISIAHLSSQVAAQTSVTAHAATEAATEGGFYTWLFEMFNLEGVGFGGMLSYFSSRWALATFAVVGSVHLLVVETKPRANLPLVDLIESHTILRVLTTEPDDPMAHARAALLCPNHITPGASAVDASSDEMPNLARLQHVPLWRSEQEAGNKLRR